MSQKLILLKTFETPLADNAHQGQYIFASFTIPLLGVSKKKFF